MGETPDEAPITVLASRYRLREILGTGGMGTVWRATDELLGRDVAVKRVRLGNLSPAEATVARERTMREARIAAALHHPHVVSIFDVVVEDGEPWLVLEFLPSRSLGHVLKERHALPPAEVAAIGAQVAAALTAAHANGIVHRDVKPDNILIALPPATLPGSSAPLVKLTDFGIAHAVDAPTLTATDVLTGTPAYFAPETAGGRGTDSRSDMYSLGATLYAAVEGHPPFGHGQDNLLGLLARITRGGAPPPRRAGPLTELLRRLTGDDPAARPTAAQTHHELDRLAREQAHVGSTPPAPAGPTSTGDGFHPPAARRRRGPVLAAVGVLAVAAVVIAIAVQVPGGGASPASGPAAAPASTTVPSDQGRSTQDQEDVPVPRPIAVGDVRTADPCSVLDTAALAGFGSPQVERDNIEFAGCRADVTQGNGGVTVTAVFETAAEAYGGPTTESPPRGHITVLRPPPASGACHRRIVLEDHFAVRLSALPNEPSAAGGDMCAIAEAATGAALDIMVEQGIGRRTDVVSMQLGGVDACGLLTAADLAVVPGLHLVGGTFGGWGCEWATDTPSSTTAQVLYYRGFPLGEADGEAADFAGRPGRVRSGPERCRIEITQRNYTVEGTPRIEAVWVILDGATPGSDRCETATAFANAAAGRLPPPS